MGGRRIKSLFEELLEAHPSAFVANVMAPGANPRETLEIMHSLYDSASRAPDQKPNGEDEQHLQSGLAEIGNVRMISKDQGA